MTTIHSPAQRAGFMRVPALALAGALLATADDYATRQGAIAPALTTADDYATRQGAIVPALTTADDYATRHRER